jgi:uncharacterized membrane protein YhfC
VAIVVTLLAGAAAKAVASALGIAGLGAWVIAVAGALVLLLISSAIAGTRPDSAR